MLVNAPLVAGHDLAQSVAPKARTDKAPPLDASHPVLEAMLMRDKRGTLSLVMLLTLIVAGGVTRGEELRVHNIFSSNMVLQRNEPIKIWGWAAPGQSVTVNFGDAQKQTTANATAGQWAVTFPAQKANVRGQKLTVTASDQTIEMDNILIGDVWVMYGQSNMAFRLGPTLRADMERAQAHLPLLRRVNIKSNENYKLQQDLPDSKVTDWSAASPKTVGGFSAIGYAFGSRLQRALQIPVGIIDNARGGASIESLVPRHKFDDHPLAKRYLEWVEQKRANFNWDKAMKPLIEKWKKKVAKQRDRGVAEDKLPTKPTRQDLRSWSVPGRSPSHAASCYNGMFGVFKGLNIKGMLFHQGYNNAIGKNAWPKRYRLLMQLMVEGVREDFDAPDLPVGVIGLCAGGIPQTPANFETWGGGAGAYIREAQRLGLTDLDQPTHTAFLPAYDVQIPGLHPHKKRPHGTRAARWALSATYDKEVTWQQAKLVSAKRDGNRMVLRFDTPVLPDDMSTIPKGFAIAGEDGKFYKAYAAFQRKKNQGIWDTANKSYNNNMIYVWSPMVEAPQAVRYGWARSPMGNLKVNGKAWQPLHSFRTDEWDWPESKDPANNQSKPPYSRKEGRQRAKQRRLWEAKHAVEVLKKRKKLEKKDADFGN
jgi:sialate O-acetylesterase